MTEKRPEPFLAGQQRDVVSDLAEQYAHRVYGSVFEKIAGNLDPDRIKIDGKGGALDGVLVGDDAPDVAVGPPGCWAYPGPPPKGKDSKETKEGKESKDGKEGKEGKEAKDSKEGKESTDGGGKYGGDESTDPFERFGDREVLPVDTFEVIVRNHPERVQLAVKRGALMKE